MTEKLDWCFLTLTINQHHLCRGKTQEPENAKIPRPHPRAKEPEPLGRGKTPVEVLTLLSTSQGASGAPVCSPQTPPSGSVLGFIAPSQTPTSQASWAEAGVSSHHPFLQRALEPEALVSEQFITHQPAGITSNTACITRTSSPPQSVLASSLRLHPHPLSSTPSGPFKAAPGLGTTP